MTNPRDQLRNKIDALECLHDVMGAIDDVSSAEFGPNERPVFKLAICDSKDKPVAFAHSLSAEIVLIGLRAMRQALHAQAKQPMEVEA